MSQQQTVNVADLDIAQLSEVRKQLEDVIVHQPTSPTATNRDRHWKTGIDAPHQLVRATEAGSG